MNNQCTCVYNGPCDRDWAGCQCGCWDTDECFCECHDFSLMRHFYLEGRDKRLNDLWRYAEDSVRSLRSRQPHSDTWAAFKEWVRLFG